MRNYIYERTRSEQLSIPAESEEEAWHYLQELDEDSWTETKLTEPDLVNIEMEPTQ